MRLERTATSWVMYPTTEEETQVFARIIALTQPGERFHRNDRVQLDDAERMLIAAGGPDEMVRFDGQRHPNCRYGAWVGGVALPVVVRDDDMELRALFSAMSVYGLTYAGSVGDGLELYSTLCKLCGGRLLDDANLLDKVCDTCLAECDHPKWESGHIVATADGGIGMGEACTRCGLRVGSVTDDRDAVERTTGIMVITRDQAADAVNSMLAPDPTELL